MNQQEEHQFIETFPLPMQLVQLQYITMSRLQAGYSFREVVLSYFYDNQLFFSKQDTIPMYCHNMDNFIKVNLKIPEV